MSIIGIFAEMADKGPVSVSEFSYRLRAAGLRTDGPRALHYLQRQGVPFYRVTRKTVIALKYAPPKLVYIASPYSDSDPKTRELRYTQVRDFVGWLVKNKQEIAPYSPIVTWHEVATNGKLQTSAAAWESINLTYLTKVDAFHVLMLPKWHVSVGVQAELTTAIRFNLPIRYWEPVRTGYLQYTTPAPAS